MPFFVQFDKTFYIHPWFHDTTAGVKLVDYTNRSRTPSNCLLNYYQRALYIETRMAEPRRLTTRLPPLGQTSSYNNALLRFKKRFRDPKEANDLRLTCNIMADRRVVRGTTFCPAGGDPRELPLVKQEAARRFKGVPKSSRHCIRRVGTPPPVSGRRHEHVQTQHFLEEAIEKPPSVEVSCQTDLFLGKPGTPRYVPCKTGIDKWTQIYKGDLFDFDTEVLPILEVLTSKTLEQAVLEVLEEEEMASLRTEQERFRASHAENATEIQRLEEREVRLGAEKEARTNQHSLALSAFRDTQDRIAAATLSRGYLKDLLPSVLEGLHRAGYLVDEIRADVEEGFLPWLENQVQGHSGRTLEVRAVLSEILKVVLKTRAEAYKTSGEAGSNFRRDSADKTATSEDSEDLIPFNLEPSEPVKGTDVRIVVWGRSKFCFLERQRYYSKGKSTEKEQDKT
uniref:Uncharacterized protein n=1 Tax=Timema douglasi TaxID=61478 RepID=A0A7R8VB75_TIMDO|nr:unnamed protein product [Timema douglasi]